MSSTVDHRAPEAPDIREEALAGWRTVLPAGLAVLPLGIALGVLVVQSDLAWWWGPVLAAVVFAGSLEFLLVGMFAATAPLGQIALSSLLVNARHAFYALSFPLHRIHGPGWRAYSTFALTDESYALTSTPEAQRWSQARIITIQAGFHLCWVLSVLVGSAVGSVIPPEVVGLDFAVTALFVVLTIEAWKVQRTVPGPALALASAAVALTVAPDSMLPVAMTLFVGSLVIMHLATKGGAHRG